MLCGKYFLFYFLSLFFFKSTTVYGLIDPITGTFVVGAFVSGYFLNSNYILPYFGGCPKTFEIKDLEHDMKKSFFGQHIASKIVVSALAGNLHRSSKNKKPLVMSFHGSTGSGKNFLSDLIAKHMFKSNKVKELRYYVIHGRSKFPLQSKINDYKEKLYSDVKSAIKSCDTNLFVFDEIHYIPMGILDILIPILENNDVSVDSRNSIFIFLTNTASDSIIKKYLELWVSGVSRERMKVQDFDTILLKSAFNEEGGLKKSAIIDSHIIDHYVPFLPLEKVHVQQCIEAELKNLKKHLDSETKSEILQIITFGPEPQKLFSSSGCKRIKALVTTELESNLI
ncbi:torsin-1A-like [Metopolophium dirhodum]|uniref:torsin-1A-like n=1 Tax=Metopolophium dirhodum TaxID=44670 RepID=UPI00298F93B7|nr:torsin-1A-like [Metopolophium dirhodum]